MIYKFIAILSIVLFFSGCSSRTYDQNYYLEHPEKLKMAIEECQHTKNEGENPYCKIVYMAGERTRTTLFLAMQNSAAFGEKILHLQMDIAELEQKAQQANSKDSEQIKLEILEKKSLVKQYLAVLRLIGI